MIHPQGLAANAAFQKNGRSVIDTRRLFFDGNSQGGIMGGALTALAPDFNRAVLGVPGHELLDPAPAQRRLRHLRAADLPGLPGRVDAAADARRDPAALGPRRGQRLRAAHHDRPAAGTRPRTRCSCTWRSATTRSPTPPPRSRRARSARAATCPVLDPGRSPWQRFQLIPSISRFPFGGSAIVMLGLRHAGAADHEHAQPRRRGPARGPALDARGARAEVGVPQDRRARDRRLQRQRLCHSSSRS